MASLRVCSIALVVMAVAAAGACVDLESEPDLGEEEQHSGTDQGGDLQGGDLQGGDLQGGDLQGGDLQGPLYGGVGAVDATISGTALSVWRTIRTFPPKLEERRPDRICTWNQTRTTNYGCTMVTPSASTPSPIAGATFKATFRRPDGTTVPGFVRIGETTSSIGAVQSDNSLAMYKLNGHASVIAAGCPLVSCDGAYNCRRNCDMWTYDVDVIVNGVTMDLCPPNTRAYALPGQYDQFGTRSSNGFTFACMNGTAAKCTRWGYRPFGEANKSDGSSTQLVQYHESCVRAAMADYCAIGHTFTKNGTLVDVYDYGQNEVGLIPRTRMEWSDDAKSAFVWESTFDRLGAVSVDGLRFWEEPALGTLETKCPGKFSLHENDDVAGRWDRASGWDGHAPQVRIDATTWCHHNVRTVGKWLHEDCSACTRAVSNELSYCGDPSSPKGWDSLCVSRVNALCTNTPPHSECTTGAALGMKTSGCAFRVCSTAGYGYCCSSTWDSACATKANNTCSGYKAADGINYPFCGFAIANPPPNSL